MRMTLVSGFFGKNENTVDNMTYTSYNDIKESDERND